MNCTCILLKVYGNIYRNYLSITPVPYIDASNFVIKIFLILLQLLKEYCSDVPYGA